MPIITVCQGCGQRLSVADENAGRIARCPKCRRQYKVPPADRLSPTPSPFSDHWRMRTEEGRVYGPVSKAELDVWVAEGRVTAQSQLALQNDESWQPATVFYPQLQAGAGVNPFADRALPPASDPYAAPQSSAPITMVRHQRPHRGGVVLVVGILGLICCQIVAPIAWIMGHSDLNLIRQGYIDPSGRSLTQVGMVLGIIGTLVLLIQIAVVALGGH